MANQKTSKKRRDSSASFLNDMPKMKLKQGVKTRKLDPDKMLVDRNFIAQALGEALLENEIEAFKEILLAHLQAVDKKMDVIERSGMNKTTFYQALSPRGNPSLKTLGKIISALAA